MITRGLESSIVCDQCGSEFPVSAVNIQSSDLEINGTRLEATYFRCPRCAKAYLVQIVDAKCIQLREEFVKQRDRVHTNVGRNNGIEWNSVQYTSMLAKHKRFKERFVMLMDQYHDMVSAYLDGTENKTSGR